MHFLMRRKLVLKLFLFDDMFEDKMKDEKRKYSRSKCVLPAELIDSEGRSIVSGRVKVKDFSNEGLKLSISLTQLKPGSSVDIKVYLPEKKITTLLSGEVTWNKYAGDKMEMGLKIKDVDESEKAEILNWLFPKWITRETEKEKKKKIKSKIKKKAKPKLKTKTKPKPKTKTKIKPKTKTKPKTKPKTKIKKKK